MKPGPKTTPNPARTVRISLVVEGPFLGIVDAWRIQQPDKPKRSEAMRRMAMKTAERDGITQDGRLP